MGRHPVAKGGAPWANGKHTGAGKAIKHSKKQIDDVDFDYTQDLFDATVTALE